MNSSATAFDARLVTAAEPAVFTEAELDGLPDPVRRYLRAAISPGTPLATAARLRMRGRLRLGRWLPFRATELLAPARGFRWSARVAGVISGADRCADGTAEMDWRLFGVVPVARAVGPDLARSAAGRAAGEGCWLPTALLPRYGTQWTAIDERQIRAELAVGGIGCVVDFFLDERDRIVRTTFDRWGDPDRTGHWGRYPFGFETTAYRSFGGLTVPAAGRAGWFPGTDRWAEGEFFRCELTDLRPVPPG
jgi:hypothetical protein